MFRALLLVGIFAASVVSEATESVSGFLTTPSLEQLAQGVDRRGPGFPGFGGGGGWRPDRPGRPGHPGRPPGPPPHRPPPHRPPMPPPHYPPQPPVPPPNYGERYVEKVIYVNRHLQYGRFELLSMLSPQDRFDLENAELQGVRVNIQSAHPGTVSLFVNNQFESSETFLGPNTELRVNRYVRLDRFSRVDLESNTQMYVGHIVIRALQRGHGGGGHNQYHLRWQIFGSFQHPQRLDIAQAVGLYQHQGARVVQVQVRVRQLHPHFAGQAALLINGNVVSMAQTDMMMRDFFLPVQGNTVVGYGLHSLQFDAAHVAIDEIVVHLAR